MPSRFARFPRVCNGENDASAGEPVNSLLSSYGALPGGSNPQRRNAKPLFTTIHPFPITFGGPAGAGARLDFLLPRRAYVRNEPWIGSPVVFVIAASFAEAQVAIDRSANHVRVAVILSIILPPANLAKLQRLRHSQGSIPAAKAAGRSRSSHPVSMRWMASTPASPTHSTPLRR
jgi:hypothetical protein